MKGVWIYIKKKKVIPLVALGNELVEARFGESGKWNYLHVGDSFRAFGLTMEEWSTHIDSTHLALGHQAESIEDTLKHFKEIAHLLKDKK